MLHVINKHENIIFLSWSNNVSFAYQKTLPNKTNLYWIFMNFSILFKHEKANKRIADMRAG